MENRYGFTIADYIANVVIHNSESAYTFLINRDSIVKNVFENLVISVKNNQEPTAHIIKYESAPFLNNQNITIQNFVGNIIITKIVYNATQINSLIDYEACQIMQTWMCKNHDFPTADCTGGPGGTVIICAGGGSDNVTTSGNTYTTSIPNYGSSTSSSGGSGGNVNTINTAPVGPPLVDPAKDPCTKVQKMKDNAPTVSAELQTLGNKRTEAVEHGLYKLNNSSNFTPIIGANSEINLPDAPAGSQFTVLGHTHNSPSNTTYSIFSYADFQLIVERISLGQISPDCIITLSTADGTNYAMTIDDQAAFLQFFAQPGDSNFDLQSYFDLDKVIDKVYGLNEDSPIPVIKVDSNDILGDEIAFINMLSDYNMGASLMEANATFTTFTKVSYDKKKKMIIKQPCN